MDCLRTVEAQEAMQQVVRDNGWSDDYVSPPGYGPHPRGMAVDLVPVDGSTGKEIDMGAPFDHFAEKSNRDCMQLTAQQQDNRQTLNHAVFTAAEELGFSEKFIGHPQEWWDFRFTEPTWKAHEPIKESDLPENLRLVKPERIQSAAGRGR
jgi:D-alanyl-D-alanine dipeptidase